MRCCSGVSGSIRLSDGEEGDVDGLGCGGEVVRGSDYVRRARRSGSGDIGLCGIGRRE